VQDTEVAKQWVNDTRKPFVLDAGLRILQVIDAEEDTTLGVIVSWGCHPETLWSKNLLITSDYPNYLRKGIEEGIFHEGKLVQPGVGGITVFFNGAIGGLMTTDPGLPIADPISDTLYREPSFDKARAQGYQLALAVLKALNSSKVKFVEKGSITLRAKTIQLPVKNKYFRIGALLSVLDRGFTGWMKTRSEVAAFRIGPVSFLAIPGEIYPELIEGGVESPPGNDFNIEPVELPPLRSLMPGKIKFVIGLANDEIGYIIPKSEWDTKPPYLYHADKSPYGEINSLGPETAPIIHETAKQLLIELKEL